MHTTEAAAAAISEAGIKGALDSAKALAMTVVDLLTDSTTVKKIKKGSYSLDPLKVDAIN